MHGVTENVSIDSDGWPFRKSTYDVPMGEKCSGAQISIEELAGASNQNVSNHWTPSRIAHAGHPQVFIVLDAWSN